MNIITENPKTSAATVATTAGIFNLFIFDPYSRCSLFMSILSAIFTYGIFAGIYYLSVIDIVDHVVTVITHVASAAGAVLTTFAVYKKLNTRRRKKRIQNGKN